MPFRPKTNTTIKINHSQYTFTEHPAAKGMPYGQTGRRATVYQVRDKAGRNHALKVFTRAFRSVRYEETASRLAKYSQIAGLQVCSRDVFTEKTQAALLQTYPDLKYSLLMPWVEGKTWQEMVLGRQPLEQAQSKKIAASLLGILHEMERQKIAHCDLAGPNILIHAPNGTADVALVDVEDLYAPDLEKPEKLPAGSIGYGHKTADQGLWSASADRFAGAILLAEILAWSDERIRRIAAGEQYFNSDDIHQTSDRYNILKDSLKGKWGTQVSELFIAAWFSETLDACPTFDDWRSALGNGPAPVQTTSSRRETPAALPAVHDASPLTDAGRYLFTSFRELLVKKDFAECEKLVHALSALAPEFDVPQRLLDEARESASQDRVREELQEKLAQLEKERQKLTDDIQAQLDKLSQGRQTLEEKLLALDKKEQALKERNKEVSTLDEQIADIQRHLDMPIVHPTVSLETRKGSTRTKQIAPKHNLPTYKKWKPIKIQQEVPSNLELVDAKFLAHFANFYTVDPRGKLKLCDFEGNFVEKWATKIYEATNISFDKIKKRIAIGDNRGSVAIYNMEPEFSRCGECDVGGCINALSFSPVENFIAIGSEDGAYILYIDTGDVNQIRSREVYDLTYSPDGNTLGISYEDGTVELIQKGISPIQGKTLEGSVLTFDLNSAYLIAADRTGKITVFDAATMLETLSFSTIVSNPISALAISPDNSLLATGTEEGIIFIWSLGDGKLLETIEEHDDYVNGLDFHQDGKHLLSCSDDGRAILWKIQ